MPPIQFVEEEHVATRIRVVGVGGGGCNAVDSMIDMGLSGVEFCNINTDSQALHLSTCPTKLHVGIEMTSGMGCGGDPALGEKAAQASKDKITEVLKNCDMVFIAAGLGGGTGTGAAPVVAEIAKSLGLLTVAIVTKPFAFEGPQRLKRAEMGLKKLSEFVDTKIVILNDKLIDIVGPKTPLVEAFDMVNRVLAQGVQAISELISVPGEINVDFMDVRTIMGETGGAVMGVGVGKGENRATEAVKKACASPLQEKIVIEGARGVLISITASPDVSLQEVNMATSMVYESADPDANIIFGMVIDPEMKDEMRVTIIATGFPDEEVRFASKQNKDPLAGRKTEIDLETKLKAMMSEPERGEETRVHAAAALRPGMPPTAATASQQTTAPRFDFSKPTAIPTATPAASAGIAQQLPPTDLWKTVPTAATVPVAETPPDPQNDLETPAYLRKRKLFE
ncbi:TPA: cell division protein FtsZ [Candidatus Sumerlaeota bacterium]|nr:cell division protein FtsZ [Candidatus Sumerlaeota bacterium]